MYSKEQRRWIGIDCVLRLAGKTGNAIDRTGASSGHEMVRNRRTYSELHWPQIQFGKRITMVLHKCRRNDFSERMAAWNSRKTQALIVPVGHN